MGNAYNTQMENESIFLSDASSTHFYTNNEDQSICIWLDSNALKNSLAILRIKILIQELNNDHCLFFDNTELFLSEISKLRTTNKKIILILSGLFAEEIFPLKITDNISSVIIFCKESYKYRYLLEKYSYINDICSDHELLEKSIQKQLLSNKFKLFNNQKMNLSQLVSNSSMNLMNNSPYFSRMLLIECLKQISQIEQTKDIMLNKCEDYYLHNTRSLGDIEIFRETYTSNQAIDWYIKDSFIYRLINRVFRTDDITLWYLFSFYMVDLCKQLEYVHKQQNIQTSMTLYHGQNYLPTKEFEIFRSNIGSLVSANGFFSTTRDLSMVKSFIQGATDTDEFKVAIFEIFLDGNSLKNAVFVDIDQYTGQSFESEVLFDIDSIFEVLNVYYDNSFETWKIQMKATNKDTHFVKEYINKMKKQYQYKNTNLLFGRSLLDIGKYTKAELYFQMMLDILPKSHPDFGSIYECLGDLNMQITNWNEAYKNFSLAYEIKKKRLSIYHQDLGIILNKFGNYYEAIEDYNQAFIYYKKALKYQNNQAITLLNISSILLLKKEYQNAFNFSMKAREIFEEHSSYIQIIQCQSIIGNIYFAQKDYDIAEEFYLTAYEMCKKYLFIDHRYRMSCIKALTNLYKKQNLKEKAIRFCREQFDFYEQHFNVVYLLIIMAELYEDDEIIKIIFLEKAARIFEENDYLQYNSIGNCWKLIGQYYVKNNEKNKALMYYRRTLKIQMKIYPKDHFIFNKIRCLINTCDI